MPKFITLNKIRYRACFYIHQRNFPMRTIKICKCDHRKIFFIQDPFAMIECITLWGSNRSTQFSLLIGNKQTFMHLIAFSNKFGPSLSCKIQEKRLFRSPVQRSIASLITIEPYRIDSFGCYRRLVLCNTGPQ